MNELTISQERFEDKDAWGHTGIYVRAKHKNGGWESVDIVLLEKESLLEWLRSRGGNNPWAEDCVGLLLGHGHLHSHN